MSNEAAESTRFIKKVSCYKELWFYGGNGSIIWERQVCVFDTSLRCTIRNHSICIFKYNLMYSTECDRYACLRVFLRPWEGVNELITYICRIKVGVLIHFFATVHQRINSLKLFTLASISLNRRRKKYNFRVYNPVDEGNRQAIARRINKFWKKKNMI